MQKDEKEEPTLTAVIPIYNGEENLRRTLNNILKIKYQALELILIDDGSSDNSGIICREYERLDERIKYIRQENQGIAASRNRGLELAGGKYICFWDQDDLVIAEGLFSLLEKMQKESAQMGMCSTRRMIGEKASNYERMQEGVFIDEEIKKELLYPLLFRGYQYHFLKSESYFYGTVWKCIFQTDFVRDNEICFQSFVHYEDDWLFVTKALCRAEKVVTISDAGYCWRVNEGSESHKRIYIDNLHQRYEAFDEYILGYLQQGIKDYDVMNEFVKVNLCEHYIELYRNAQTADRAADRKRCRESIKKYLRKTDYKKQLSCEKKLKKSAYRKQVVLKSLRYGGVNITFLTSQIFGWIESWINRVQWFVDLERTIKLK